MAPQCPALLPSPQPPMKKACLTLLSHLGRLHEPPVPKPRGTPKLSERYAGSERLSHVGGPRAGNGGAPGVWGVGKASVGMSHQQSLPRTCKAHSGWVTLGLSVGPTAPSPGLPWGHHSCGEDSW